MAHPTRGSSRNLKKTLFVAMMLSGAFSAFLYPLLADASIFSFLLQKTAVESSASASAFNSQTLPVLTPAKNIDPSVAVGGGDIMLVGGGALLAQEGPSGTVADIQSHPTNSQISIYTVHDGDTLASVAQMFGVSANTIVWANDIQKSTIHVGQTLVILPITGIQHKVEKGDTLATLAQRYKSDAHDIAQYNNLADDDTLALGSTVIIPDGEVSAPAPVPTVKQKTGVSGVIARVKKLAQSNKPTAPLRGAGGPEIDGYYAWPLNGGVITQGLHGLDAIDIGAPKGTSIFASAAGTVIVARSNGGWNGGYGNYIVIQHNNGTQTLYAHASQILVSEGEAVSQGQTIAKVGATGEATGMHLHFEVRGAKNPFGVLPVGLRM